MDEMELEGRAACNTCLRSNPGWLYFQKEKQSHQRCEISPLFLTIFRRYWVGFQLGFHCIVADFRLLLWGGDKKRYGAERTVLARATTTRQTFPDALHHILSAWLPLLLASLAIIMMSRTPHCLLVSDPGLFYQSHRQASKREISSLGH